MKLPARLNELLMQDNGLNAFVLNAITIIEPWARDNKTVFFPDYTDHSLLHLQEVLSSADSLISDQSWQHLTPEDAAIISIAVLLHDCALHISEDGFFSLVDGHHKSVASRYIQDAVDWPSLWVSFLAEARRFDQRKLTAILGDTEPIGTFPGSKLNLTLRHRLLAGEFLRRHHSRLAHEIALSGIPGPSNPFPIGDSQFRDLLDLAGFVARSHNLPIRAAVDRIEPNKRRVHLNCRVPFAMVVLRIADYIQMHSSRAPGQLLRLKGLTSPVSRGEWKKHASVREINQAHEDPDAIFVDCEPESASVFAGMQRLFHDIQSELDQSWAVMGEVYGRFSPLNELGIAIRRIRSNIDDPVLFQQQRSPSYLPKEYKFRTASGELMDLLIAPLYGDKPEIGVRELVQNAVDACLERDDLLGKGLIPLMPKPSEDVVVTLEIPKNGTPSITIDDYGVGMTPAVVEQYFLNIGASFRSSDLWRENHEVAGHSSIHRTGRFGIGVLAAFLLGYQMRVTTRHISSDENCGIEFTCTQGDESIEIHPCNFRHGTRIQINISPAVADRLNGRYEFWDWYCLEQPQVRRHIISGFSRDIPQRYTVPMCDADLSSTKWRRIVSEGYDDLMWSYEPLGYHNQYRRYLVCNGIYVDNSPYRMRPSISPKLGEIFAETPAMVVFDPDGRFPLNLQRDKILTAETGFKDSLALDISEYFSAELVKAFDGIAAGVSKESVLLSVQPPIVGLGGRDNSSSGLGKVILRHDGILPVDSDLLREAQPNLILVDAININAKQGAYTSSSIRSWAKNYVAVDSVSRTKTSRTEFLRNSIGGLDYAGERTGYFAPLPIIGRRLLVRKSDVKELVTPGNVPRSQWGQLRKELDLSAWALWSMGTLPELDLDVSAVCTQLEDSESFGLTLLYLDWSRVKESTDTTPISPFAKAWKKVVGSAVFLQRLR